MKNNYLSLLTILLAFFINAQNPNNFDTEFDSGSKISITELDQKNVEDLVLLGRIWGFLKYYHPKVANGNYNWDYELFRILPSYLDANSDSQRNALLVSWIKKYGEVEPCKSCENISDNAFLKPNFSWIKDASISNELQDELQFILKNRFQGNHFYIDVFPKVGNPKFINEASYSDMTYPDDGFRLLTVYRYWNIINYFFPYKHLMDKNWDTCLEEYIPKFINAKDQLEFEKAALLMIGDIKDTHANLWSKSSKIQEARGEFYAPIHVKFVENQLIVDALFDGDKSKNCGLQLGDVITHINSEKVEDLVDKMNKFYPASNQPTRLRNISFDILRSKDKSINLIINRDNRDISMTLNLYKEKEISGYYRWYKKREERSYHKINENIGYVTLQNITKKDVSALKEEFKDTKALIIDIRNYPSTFVPFTLGNYTNSNRAEFVKFTKANLRYPGEFKFDESLKVGIKRSWSYKGKKVIVLVNEITQSQAEYTALAFRAGDKTTIIGSKTAGADGNVSRIDLPGGLRTSISGIGVYYPDGTETQRVGIVPDIEVKPTIDGIKNGRDELMEKALELINESLFTNKND